MEKAGDAQNAERTNDLPIVDKYSGLSIYNSQNIYIKIFNRNEFKYGNKLREIKKKFGENSCGIRVFFFALDVNALRLRICRN